jgi:hypothetical protein
MPCSPASSTRGSSHLSLPREEERPAGEQVFDLYHDAVTNQWALDVAHD